MNKTNYVVGSGPSGIAAAYSLVKAGHEVTLVDVGFTIEDEYQDLVNRYDTDHDAGALINNIHSLRRQYQKQSNVQPAKSLFGSNYPYKTIEDTEVETDDKTVIRSSLAKGGLSSVWGANVSCVVPKDISDWPIGFEDLKPYYSFLEEIVDISSPKDEMSEIFPMNLGHSPTYPLGKQGTDLYENLKKNRPALAKDGIHVGRAKLAIGPMYSKDGKGCTPCGLCMHGCPNNAIFNSAFVFDKLLKYDNFTYLPNKLLTRFSEDNGEVNLYLKDLNTNDELTLTGSRLFIACGVINSTSIVARSLNMTDHEFTIKDSQKYLFPIVRWQRSKGCLKEKENTADQIYLDIDNPSVSKNIAHLQYYGYNDLFLDPIRQKLGAATEVIPKLFASFFERLMICFVYFHSDDSGTMSLKVNAPGSGEKHMAEIKGHINPKSGDVMKSIMQLLKKHHRAFGVIPVELGLQTTLPGDSQHTGCTLPMSKTPGPYETDCLGRPSGCERVHVVDSSILPSIPATPTAFTVMANTCRIVDSVNKETMGVTNA